MIGARSFAPALKAVDVRSSFIAARRGRASRQKPVAIRTYCAARSGSFDPVTNSQEPDVKSFKLATERLNADKVTIAATMTGHRNEPGSPADLAVHYDFAREGDKWKIDDIRGAVDGKPWSIRKLLTDYLNKAGQSGGSLTEGLRPRAATTEAAAGLGQAGW